MLEGMGATEDDAWRRLIAGQKPVNVAGRSIEARRAVRRFYSGQREAPDIYAPP